MRGSRPSTLPRGYSFPRGATNRQPLGPYLAVAACAALAPAVLDLTLELSPIWLPWAALTARLDGTRILAGHASHRTEDRMDARRFDSLVLALAERVASRRLVATGLFAAAVAPALGGLDAAAKRRHKHRKRRKRKPLRCQGDSCDGTGGKPCGGRDGCQCYRAAQGGNVCASAAQSSLDRTCDTHKDCRRGQVCVEGGPACGGSGLRFCKKACSK
jgi:hypothetical protein